MFEKHKNSTCTLYLGHLDTVSIVRDLVLSRFLVVDFRRQSSLPIQLFIIYVAAKKFLPQGTTLKYDEQIPHTGKKLSFFTIYVYFQSSFVCGAVDHNKKCFVSS